jgi:hypothetical protein
MNRDNYLEPSPVRADGGFQPVTLPASIEPNGLRGPDHRSAARGPLAALNSPLSGGFSKQNTLAVPEHVPSPLRAIRAKCIDCSGGNMAEVRRCTVYRCAVYPFRMGRNPNRRRAAQ